MNVIMKQHYPSGSWKDRFLTTRQLGEMLHIKERKVYALASSGEIPCVRALGKLLFERAAVEAWLNGHGSELSGERYLEPARVYLGCHDPMLEWCMRESGSSLATFLDPDGNGMELFGAGQGMVAGLHLYCPAEDEWNLPVVRGCFSEEPVVLMEWAWRERGLIVAPGNPHGVKSLRGLPGLRVMPRCELNGSQDLLSNCLARADVDASAVVHGKPARTEVDAALAVLDGEVDAAFGLKSVAQHYHLDFVPVVRERLDLLVWRRQCFEEPLRALLDFFRSPAFLEKAGRLDGYDFSGLGRTLFNGK